MSIHPPPHYLTKSVSIAAAPKMQRTPATTTNEAAVSGAEVLEKGTLITGATTITVLAISFALGIAVYFGTRDLFR